MGGPEGTTEGRLQPALESKEGREEAERPVLLASIAEGNFLKCIKKGN